MAKKSPVAPIVDKFSKEYEKLAIEAEILITKYLKQGQTLNKAVDNALKETLFLQKIVEFSEKAVLDSGAVGYGSEVKEVEKFVAPFGIKEQVVNSGIVLSIKDEILVALKRKKTYTEVARQLLDSRDISQRLPKYLDNMVQATRRGLKDPVSRATIRKSLSQIEKLAQNGAPNTSLKKAYRNLVKVVESENQEAIEKAIQRAMRQKARYRAERIARTEIARAAGIGHDLRASLDDDVIGVKYSLSTRHKVYDICDFHTGADLYGMGKGVYPKSKKPPYPFHPHCLCFPSDVFVGEAERKPFNEDKAESYIKSQPRKNQTLLLGVKGRERFRKSGKWRGSLRNWNGHEKPDFEGIDQDFFK